MVHQHSEGYNDPLQTLERTLAFCEFCGKWLSYTIRQKSLSVGTTGSHGTGGEEEVGGSRKVPFSQGTHSLLRIQKCPLDQKVREKH